MADQSVVNFIKSAQQRGSSKGDIEQALIKKGWTTQQIADAFAEASRVVVSSNPSNTNLKGSNQVIKIALGVCVVLFIVVGAILFFTSDECSSNMDCDAGYQCDNGECVVEEAECSSDRDCDEGYQCSYGECVIEEVEPECGVDSDCGSGYECDSGFCVKSVECYKDSDCDSGYECNLGECEKESSSTTTTSYPNYKILGVDSWSVSVAGEKATIGFNLNLTNQGNSNSTSNYYYSCNISNPYSSTIYGNTSKNSGYYLGVNETEIVGCNINAVELYYTVLDTHYPLSMTLTAYVDVYNNITESNEADNTYTFTYTLNLSNFSSAPTVSCTTDTICESYFGTDYFCNSTISTCQLETASVSGSACASDSDCTNGFACENLISNVCYSSCVDYDTGCANGYVCLSSVCVAEDTESVCSNVLPTCADGVDNDNDGFVDLADMECASWTDFEEGSSVGTYDCSDLEDNDADGTVDYFGICVYSDGTKQSCTEISTAGLCGSLCNYDGGVFYDRDTNCAYNALGSESTSYSAPSIENNFLNFVFRSETVSLIDLISSK